MVVAVKQPCRVRYHRRKPPVRQRVTVRAAAPTEEDERPFRVKVDLDLCQGHAVCMNDAPELFDLERDPKSGQDKVVLLNENPGPELLARARTAARHCPTHALSIEE